ncbi:MAG: hypothetical protein Q9225_004224 [Loekoesia sp. 1 TL-2023]
MPRRKVDLENLPTVPQALQERIEEMAASSMDTILRDVRQLPWTRHAHLRDSQAANWTLVRMVQRRDRALEATRKWKKDYNKRTASKFATQPSSSSQIAIIKTEGFKPLQSHDPLAFAVPMKTHMPDTAEDEMTLLGDLKVPNPGFCGLGEARVNYIFSILPELRKLDERNYPEIPGHADLSFGYEEFVEREMQAWTSSADVRGSPKSSSLVNASGSLKSVIAHHLNQPSFTTDGKFGNETADKSNPCIAMVMGNGFKEGESLIFDHIHRRDPKSQGLKTYPEAVLAAHEDRTRRIMASSAAKVEVVYGRVVQNRILQTMRCTILPLWGWLNGISLVLVYENNFDNQDEKYKYRRVILFATHPQHMFYEQRGSPVAIRQDLTFEVASLISSRKIKVDAQYYQSKKWYGKIPSVSQSAHTKARELLSLLDIEITVEKQNYEIEPVENTADLHQGEWEKFFNQKPHSNRKSRELLPAALEACMALDKSDKDWHDPSQMPGAVLEWFKGQKDVLFYYRSISSIRDIELASKKCLGIDGFPDHEEPYQLRDLLFRLMLKQRDYLAEHNIRNDDLLFQRVDGSEVEIVCPCGEYRSSDENPRYKYSQPWYYVMKQTRKCKSLKCGAKAPGQKYTNTVRLQPVSTDLLGTKDERSALLAENVRKYPKPYRALVRRAGEGPPRPSTIKQFCCLYKEKTLTIQRHGNNESNIYVDNNAQ